MPDKKEPDQEPVRRHQFISEKIIRQPLTKREIVRYIVMVVLGAVLFGVVAAICFVLAKPAAQHYLGLDPQKESEQITIPKDEPETTQAPVETTAEQSVEETEPIEDMVRSEMEKYQFSIADLNTLYGNLHAIASEADKGIVAVHSVKHQTDWFDNPIEMTGQWAGVLIACTEDELLILTPEEAVEEADSIKVAFTDGTEVDGTVKQSDSISGMAVVSVATSQISQEEAKRLAVIEMGNAYSVKQGDLVLAVGAPAGLVHSTDYGFLSYVVKNVQAVDGINRIFYTNIQSDSEAGTFLLNTAGELIGWSTNIYDKDEEQKQSMTRSVCISDYKWILEKLTNGAEVPYFGIKGQEISAAKVAEGMPEGVYVVNAIADSPAYGAGIQSGDIITQIGGEEITSMKDFQAQVEHMTSGQSVMVKVRRDGRDEYKELEYQVVIGAR